MKKPALLIIVLILTALTLFLVKIYIANNIATAGVKLVEVEKEVNRLETENSMLSEKLYRQASLTYIYEKAQSLGFVKKSSSYVLSSQIPIAVKK